MMADSNEEAVGEVLERAADLIEPEGAWTQKYSARAADGSKVLPTSPYASCWCVMGAINRITRNSAWNDDTPEGFSTASSPTCLTPVWMAIFEAAAWNDAPGRTQAEVVAKLREVAALARAATLVKEGGRG